MSVLKVYRNAAWEPVDLKGPPGDPGAAGAAGAFTWPASNYRNYTNTSSMGDGVYEPGPLSIANTGSNPATQVAGDTRRVEVLRTGNYFFHVIFGCQVSAVTAPSWANIRRVNGDVILNSSVLMAGETDIGFGATFSATVGETFKVIFAKTSGNTQNVVTIIRTVLLV
jgi:hypothetical protein